MKDARPVIEAARNLAEARVRYARAFTMARITTSTDAQAHQMAIEQTHDEITMAQVELEIAKWRLENE